MADDRDLKLENPESKNLTPEKIKEEAEKVETEPILPEKRETAPELRETLAEKEETGTKEQLKTTPPAGLVDIGEAAQAVKEREEKVGKILEAGMEEIYLNLPANKQAEFKAKGEETVREINGLLGKAKVKVEKIISLIKKWLSVIPGVNKFFLEQEAKIKADEIMKLKER
ncbi:MAG: hypothetical protein PHZ04_01680 [Patescibacteria group bacterium]|nr:hypothetical protein [Patescibacteria group bacterium]MDD5295163.1 hypothetical protein [Patescibacteria group bacterium]MDD5554775.1 hypothetical protein [Patescibacteria group bacterium]